MSALQQEIWTFHVDLYGGDVDMTGFEVEALDGGIGKIDEATTDAGASCVVVDTGPWIFGKKVMLPASTIDRIEPEEEKVFVNRTKEQIENAPEFDEKRRDDERYRSELGTYYGRGGPAYREPRAR